MRPPRSRARRDNGKVHAMTTTEKKKRLRVTVKRALCLGCRSCELACGLAHSDAGDLKTAIRTGKKLEHRIRLSTKDGKPVPVICMHCAKPACVAACPEGALSRAGEGEPVLLDSDKCIGCKKCIEACPFGAITVASDGKTILKCDLCAERRADGKEPACVSACPTHALTFDNK